MPGIQLPVGIDTVNPVPADFKYGPYANTAAAIAAIPQVLRYDGLTVKINGAGEYWWLAADLTNTGLIPKANGLTNPVCTLQMQKTSTPNPNTLGAPFNFVHTDNGPEIDVITLGVTEIFRDASGPIYNIAVEGAPVSGISPANTEWNSVFTDVVNNGHANIQNVTTRAYNDFVTALNAAVGTNILTTPLVMHDLITDKYYLFTFTQWTQGGGGGGFAYTRTEVILNPPTVICDGSIHFDDLTIQDTAAYSLPRVRYVYLVQDAQDVVTMGGTLGNAYNTIQAAWNAAGAIITANPGYTVVIKAGVISATAAGNLTITNANNFGNDIYIQGINNRTTILGDINVDPAVNTLILNLLDLKAGNINFSGYLLFRDCSKIEVADVSCFYLQVISCTNVRMGNLNLLGGTPTVPSAVQVYGSAYVKFGDIIGTQIYLDLGSPSYGSEYNSHHTPIIVNNIDITNTRHYEMFLIGVTVINNFTYNASYVTVITNNFIIDNVKVYGTTTINRNGNAQKLIIDSSNFERLILTGSTFAELVVRDSDFKNITDVPDNTTFMNSTVYDPLTLTPAIDGIGTSCEFYNTSIVGGSLAIDNAVPVSVKFTTGASSARAPMGANVTLT